LTAGWVNRVTAAENRGELLIAYDLAMRGLARHPGDVELTYLAVRVLARSGAIESATASYARFKLGRQHGLDFAMLGARLAKDKALAAPARWRLPLLHAAAGAYRRIFARTDDAYPAVNAATLYLLAGDEARARNLARHALNASSRMPVRTLLDRYYKAATRGEAALILGDAEAARSHLDQAARLLGTSYSAAATTRRQLRLVCRARRIAPDILARLRPPMVVHYDGDGAATADRAARAAEYLRHHGAGFAYGSLAAGGELVFAEACLAAGAELNVVLPFRIDEFVANLVRPAGEGWVRRFHSCLERAHSVSFATTDSYQGDDDLIGYARHLAMGMALLRAQHLETEVRHVTITAGSAAPASASLAPWQRRRLGIDVVTIEAAAARPKPRAKLARSERTPPRFARAILFGDVKGYSQLADHLVPAFQQHVMGAIGTMLRRFGSHVLYRNSWGDAIYVVMDDPAIGAECALAVQAAIGGADLARFGFAVRPELRLAAHFGPLYDGYDPICQEKTFYGAHATIAARLEPVAVPGQVYVSEAMAAALALSAHRQFRCDYVGQMPAAKGFGLMRMYLLNRTTIPMTAEARG
jgi:class 3 adenylate cyclase